MRETVQSGSKTLNSVMKIECAAIRGHNDDMMRPRTARQRALAALLALSMYAGDAAAQNTTAPRPAEWARPIAVAGVPNLHQVAGNFYRSAQPDARGFRTLAAQYGVKTVVSLRAFNADEPLARGLGMRLARYKIHTWHIEREDVVGALRTLRQAEKAGPVLLHCQHGADRTGLIAALYRIVYEGWSKEAALEEMQKGQFGYHAVWGNIPRYIRKVDAGRLRRDVGVP